MKQTNDSRKSRSYRQKQQPGEEEEAHTPVEAAPKTIPINEALNGSSKLTNNSSRKSTTKDTKHTAASFQLQPQPPKAATIATTDPRSI